MAADQTKSVRLTAGNSSGNKVARLDLAQMASKRASVRPKVDLVFVLDTTGSMSDKINGLVASLQRFADRLAEKNVEWAAAVVAFGDLTVPGDKITATGFTSNVGAFKRSLGAVPRYSGGGNDGESSFEAVIKALDLPGSRSDSIKVLVLITDEPALMRNVTASEIGRRLNSAEVLVFVVSPPLTYFKDMAASHGGEWFQVSATTSFEAILRLLDSLSESVANTVDSVQLLHSGSVGEYLKLRRGD